MFLFVVVDSNDYKLFLELLHVSHRRCVHEEEGAGLITSA